MVSERSKQIHELVCYLYTEQQKHGSLDYINHREFQEKVRFLPYDYVEEALNIYHDPVLWSQFLFSKIISSDLL